MVCVCPGKDLSWSSAEMASLWRGGRGEGNQKGGKGGVIRESVDSLCRNGANAQYMQKQKLYNFTTNMLKS